MNIVDVLLCSVSSVIMTGSYNNSSECSDRNTKRDVTLEASRENSKPSGDPETAEGVCGRKASQRWNQCGQPGL